MHVAGFRYWGPVYDEHGQPDGMGEAQLESDLPGTPISDLFVISHGWNNNAARALALYERFFAKVAKLLHGSPRTIGVVGITWPSMRWPDEDRQAAGTGGANALGDIGGAAAFDDLGGTDVDDQELPDIDDAAIFDELRDIYFGADELEALDEGEDLLARQPVDEAELERFQALLTTLTAGPDAVDALEDAGEETLVASPALEVFDQAADLAPENVVEGALGFGDGVERLWAGARQALRQATYWKMKKRAGVVGGGGVAALVGRLAESDRNLRIHLVGHSFGARLVSYAVRGLPALPPGEPSPVKSLTLLQGAFSHYAFSPALPHDPGRSGGLVVAVARVDGPTLATHSLRDLAVGRLYPWAAALGRDDAAALDSILDRWGAIGHDGAQAASAVETSVRPVGASYDFDAGRIHNLDANDVIVNGEGPSGAHSDIFHPELAWALLGPARLTG